MASSAVVASVYHIVPMDMAFDLDEALAMEEGSCRRTAASKSYVANLPTVFVPVNLEDCSVCMEGFRQKYSQSDDEEDEKNKRLPCGHVYHATCITTWLSRCNTCPLCRFQIQLDRPPLIIET